MPGLQVAAKLSWPRDVALKDRGLSASLPSPPWMEPFKTLETLRTWELEVIILWTVSWVVKSALSGYERR